MTKAKKGARIGRPPGSGSGKNPIVAVRFEPDMIAVLDAEITEEEPDRSAVVRALVFEGLALRLRRRRRAAKR